MSAAEPAIHYSGSACFGNKGTLRYVMSALRSVKYTAKVLNERDATGQKGRYFSEEKNGVDVLPIQISPNTIDVFR